MCIWKGFYTTVETLGVSEIFQMFLSFLYSPRLHLFGEIYSTNSTIVKYYYKLR